LNMMMNPEMVTKVEDALQQTPDVEAYSPRIKFGSMFSNFNETTNIRLNAVEPKKEAATCPELPGRLVDGTIENDLVSKGKILVPELIAKGMKVKVDDTVVLVATNQDGAVNGQTFIVQGILEGISGPGGRDGYIHIDDARSLLRLTDAAVSEYAVRLTGTSALPKVMQMLNNTLGQLKNKSGKRALEIHDWQKLSPFANIAKMIDLMTLFIKVMLVAIVLISIMNVMIMAVYERLKEIGTLAAMGTLPNRILSLFLIEGLLLGLFGTIVGSLISVATILILKVYPISFDFGRQTDLLLVPEIALTDVLTIGIIVTLVAVLASIQPAWKASRMDPIKALRSV
ncbi:MAG: FtsX-like permease family protein, partial [Gammaproteobacteria bacterium]|nr:FtsX-like permease family protein [Gammaproteobacteria bacterium]